MPQKSSEQGDNRRKSRAGPVISDLGIVLRSYKLGESDKILRILTREHGKRSAVAKGVRKTTSRFGARLEPLTCVSLLLHRGRNMDTIRQAEIETSFHQVREDLDLFMHASAMAELIERITVEHEPHPELFDLMFEALSLLLESPCGPEFIRAFFEFKVLASAGFELRVTACAHCGRDLGQGDLSFSLRQGGLICDSCRNRRPAELGKQIRLSANASRFLAWMSANELGRLPDEDYDTSGRELRFLMDKVLEHWLEREFKSHRVMRTSLTEARREG